MKPIKILQKLNESDTWDGNTEEYYGGTYPDPPEEKEPEEDNSWDEADTAYEESKLGLRESSILEEKPVYMNTWKNYNEHGADLSAYGIESISDGWMTIDDALEFCKKYAEDEPFINDTDGVPIEISDYDNPVEKLEQLKKIEDADIDEDVFTAFLEEGRYNDIDEIIEKIENGDYIFYEGVDDEADLAQRVIDDMGFEGVSHPEYYIDRNKVKDMIESTYDAETLEQIDLDQEADDMIDSYVEAGDKQFIEDYFDYNSYGNELAYDYTFTSTGALRSD